MSTEKSWPSRFGTLGEKVFGKDSPFNDPDDKPLVAKNHFTSDDMEPTRSPISGRYYTSKSALRAEYRAHGAEEVGTAYENGYDPSHKQKEREDAVVRKVKEQIIERWRNGR